MLFYDTFAYLRTQVHWRENVIYTKFDQRKLGAKKCKLRFNKGQRW